MFGPTLSWVLSPLASAATPSGRCNSLLCGLVCLYEGWYRGKQSKRRNMEWMQPFVSPVTWTRTVHLICDRHFLNFNVIRGQDIFEIGHCFWREIRVSSQDPNMIHVKKPDDCGTGVHEGAVFIVGGQDPVWSWRHDWEPEEGSIREGPGQEKPSSPGSWKPGSGILVLLHQWV